MNIGTKNSESIQNVVEQCASLLHLQVRRTSGGRQGVRISIGDIAIIGIRPFCSKHHGAHVLDAYVRPLGSCLKHHSCR